MLAVSGRVPSDIKGLVNMFKRPYHAECTGSRLTEVKQHGCSTPPGNTQCCRSFYFPWNSSNVPFSLVSITTSMDATSHCHPLSSLCNLPSPVAFLPHSCDIKGLVNVFKCPTAIPC